MQVSQCVEETSVGDNKCVDVALRNKYTHKIKRNKNIFPIELV